MAGSLESTEKTYKFHMQVQEESASPIKQRPARTPTKPAEEKPAVQKRDLEEAVDPAVTLSETESPATNSLSEGSNATR